MTKVKITNIRKGKGTRQYITYAHLVDFETGELLISATLDYILREIYERNYEVMS